MVLRKRKFLSHKRSRSKSTSPISLCGKSTPKNKNSSSKTSSHKTTPYKKESCLSLIENYSLDVNGLMKVPCSQCQVDITKNPKIVIPNNNTSGSSSSGNSQHNDITNKEGGNNSSSNNSNRKSNPLHNPYFSIICLNCLVNTFKQKKKNDFASMYYYIIDNLDFPFFTEDWSLQDDLKLLTNIEKLGLDNWEDIAKQMGNKGKVECESHYYTFYYKNKNDKLPNRNDVIIKKVAHNEEYYYEYDDKQGKLNKNKEFILKEQIIQNQGKIPELTSSINTSSSGSNSNTNNSGNNNHIPNRSRSLVKNQNKKKNEQNVMMTSASEILGYWPKREEFDIEYLNDAELELSELEFNDDDTKEQFYAKMKILEIYNKQLDERAKRKRFVIERNLFDIKKQIAFERKLSKEDRDIYNCLKPFARFINQEQFTELFEGFILEKNLKQRLNQLRYYQELGCKNYEDIQKVIEQKSTSRSSSL